MLEFINHMPYSWVILTRSDEVSALPLPSVRTVWSQAICCLSTQSLSSVRLSVTPCTVGHQVLCLKFSRQECWSRLLFLFPENLPDPGIEPASPRLQVVSCVAGRFSTSWATREALFCRNRAIFPLPLTSGGHVEGPHSSSTAFLMWS